MTDAPETKDPVHRYQDILDLPHHVSKTRPPMSLHDRAAQFAPFAALTGFDAAVSETARLTDRRAVLDEYEKQVLNGQLCLLAEQREATGEVGITYFRPDSRKAGGAYLTIRAAVKDIDEYERVVLLATGQKIPIRDIVAIDIP